MQPQFKIGVIFLPVPLTFEKNILTAFHSILLAHELQKRFPLVQRFFIILVIKITLKHY